MISSIVLTKSSAHNVRSSNDAILQPDAADRDRWEAYRREVFESALSELFAQRFRRSDERSEHPSLLEADKAIAQMLWQLRTAGDSYMTGEVA